MLLLLWWGASCRLGHRPWHLVMCRRAGVGPNELHLAQLQEHLWVPLVGAPEHCCAKAPGPPGRAAGSAGRALLLLAGWRVERRCGTGRGGSKGKKEAENRGQDEALHGERAAVSSSSCPPNLPGKRPPFLGTGRGPVHFLPSHEPHWQEVLYFPNPLPPPDQQEDPGQPVAHLLIWGNEGMGGLFTQRGVAEAAC